MGDGAKALIAGFVVTGGTTETVLIRGIGPALAGFNVSGNATVPMTTLVDSTGKGIASNTGWGNAVTLGVSPVVASVRSATTADFTAVGAFQLASGSGDCAFVATLPPGTYTIEVAASPGTDGIGLVEAYEMP